MHFKAAVFSGIDVTSEKQTFIRSVSFSLCTTASHDSAIQTNPHYT